MIRTIAAAFLLSLASTGMAAAADYVDEYSAPSACENPSVLGFITSRFDYKAKHYLYADLAITDISQAGQSRYEPLSETRRTSREYCHAEVAMSDGERRSVWYLIERNWGFAGIGPNIEFCISGLDPWYVYGAQCNSLR